MVYAHPMMIRTQILLPPDLLETARLYAASRKLSLSEVIRHSLSTKVKPQKKISGYAALKKMAAYGKRMKLKSPPDFATNDDYLYRLP